jgi:ABC-type transport system involved in multi-copper enzyme maturation permease subunit
MIGPLFYQEMLLGSRRTREHIFRWVYAGWLIVLIFYFALIGFFTKAPFFNFQTYTPEVCHSFVEFFLVQHFILLLIVTPAFVLGGISDEKTRGTLQYLLTTELGSVHIIVGKLLGRIYEVLLLALAGIPVFCMLGAFGGVEPILLVATILVTVFVVVGVASATFLASVWAKKTIDAILVLYFVGTIVFGGVVVLDSFGWAGPLVYLLPSYILEPALAPADSAAIREVGQRLILGLFAWGTLTTFCVALASWRLRPAYIRQLENEGRQRKARFWIAERKPVSEEPVLWKERHVEGLAPVRALRTIPRWLGISLIFGATVLSSGLILYFHIKPGYSLTRIAEMLVRLEFLDVAGAIQPAYEAFQIQGVVAMLFFSLLVGIRCSGAVTGERERMTWEALLLTPLTSQQLIRGKLWGILTVSYVYLLAYAIPVIPLSLLGGVSSLIWILIPLGVSILAMYYIGAAGLWSSVRAKGSWRSLLLTLLFGYVGGFIIYACTSPVLIIAAIFIYLFLTLIDTQLGTDLAQATGSGFARNRDLFLLASYLGLALIFWLTARFFLHSAQKWVSDRERTRHWHDEPAPRRTGRRVARSAR